jgi:hypothetical protein
MTDPRSTVAKRRLDRDKRRRELHDSNGRPGAPFMRMTDEVSSGLKTARRLTGYLRRSPSARAVGVGAAVGIAAGVAKGSTRTSDKRDVVSGDVRVQLLNKIELLTIKLHMQRRGT